MTIKALIFSLCLYVALVWTLAVYRHPGAAEFREFGLFWTAAGLCAALLFVLAARLFGWWRLWRARAALKPAPPPRRVEPVHEDDSSLLEIISEANTVLRNAPAGVGKQSQLSLSSLPLYLLVGPEGSGKTSSFISAGLEPQLLAGQVAGTVPVIPTRLCNIWLAKDAVFIEFAGRLFNGDLGRWTQLLRVLRGERHVPFWRRLWGEAEHGLTPAGVIAFCEVKNFTSGANGERVTRQSREWQERFAAIGEVFGVNYPVYQVVTKSDAITFFEDYFRRLPESEAVQVLGCTLANETTGVTRSRQVFAEAETKRLNRAFNPIFQALAERRITHLAHEPDPERRPAVYEFPREFKRMRGLLVQFLTDAFRPNPLRPGPLLRGYYFTAVRYVEEMPAQVGATQADWSVLDIASDATKLFRGDATQIFSSGNSQKYGGVTARWMFTSDLFHSVILKDQQLPTPVQADPKIELYRRAILTTLCIGCALLCLAWIWSWMDNRRLLRDVAHVSGADFQRPLPNTATLGDLQSLESLRVQVEKLTAHRHNGAPIGLRWGLYSGNSVLDIATRAYFRKFQLWILTPLNSALVTRLASLPLQPAANDPYEPAYRALKTHLIISSGSCKPDPQLVDDVLKQVVRQTGLPSGGETVPLIFRQIDFYASQLPYGNPCRISENAAVRDRARQYLARIKGVDRIYAGILASAEKTVATPNRLTDLVSNYRSVLSGPGEMSQVFTLTGWNFVEKASKERKDDSSGDDCVVGTAANTTSGSQYDAQIEQSIQKLYIREYIEQWRKFFTAFSVVSYGGPEDAAKKLEILAGHKSPLLALFAMTSNQTTFPSKSSEPDLVDKVKQYVPGLSKTQRTLNTAATAELRKSDRFSSPDDITQAFQPVHWVVPARSETWVEKSSAYIDALSQLSHSLHEISRTDRDPAVHQAAAQNYEKAIDSVRQIARGFKPIGVEGLDSSVQRLLEQPIVSARRFIITDMGKAEIAKTNGQARAFCSQLRPVLSKYPFNSLGQDLSIQELATWFAPGGEVWKFQAQVLGDLTIREGSQWKANPGKKPTATIDMLAFLNHAQATTDAFFPAGASQPQFNYALRPRLDSSYKDSTLELEIDGQLYQWTSSLRKQFGWPPPAGAPKLGAVARIRTGPVSVAVASRAGIWGIFRIFGDAEPRQLGSRLVEWRTVRGGDGRPEPIQPGPVKLEIVEFPGGMDLFNAKFFSGLKCPLTAVE